MTCVKAHLSSFSYNVEREGRVVIKGDTVGISCGAFFQKLTKSLRNVLNGAGQLSASGEPGDGFSSKMGNSSRVTHDWNTSRASFQWGGSPHGPALLSGLNVSIPRCIHTLKICVCDDFTGLKKALSRHPTRRSIER